MSPFGRAWIWATASAVACVGVWILLRLLLITELFGRATPNVEEVTAAVYVGLILVSIVFAAYESWLNRRDHVVALAGLCKKIGFRFSVPASQAELGALADWPLLKRYTKLLSRMSGVIQAYPVEVLDVIRWVGPRNDADGFEWRHTLVIFPAMTDLPAFSMHPLGMADRYLHAFTSAKGVTFVHGIGGEEQDVQKKFQAQYFVWPGDKLYFANLDTASATQTAELGAVFSADVIRFFADHPGWCVEVNAGRIVMLREDRIVVPVKRTGLLAEAAKVYRVLTEVSRVDVAALRISPEKPVDLQHAIKAMILLFLGCGVGLGLGFFASIGVVMLLASLFPDPPTWFHVLVVFVIVFGGMFSGAYAGYRVVRRFIWRSR